MRRARILAFFLDLLLCAGLANAGGLLLTLALWNLPGFRPATPRVWLALNLGALLAFLLRDSRGGRARRWLALELRGPAGAPPGPWGSIRRNLPLLIPIWNLLDAWPLLREGSAPRRCDRRAGTRIDRTP